MQEYHKQNSNTEETEKLCQLNEWLQNLSESDRLMFQQSTQVDSGLLMRNMLNNGYTTRDLGEIFNVSHSSISRIARNQRPATEDLAKQIFSFYFFGSKNY